MQACLVVLDNCASESIHSASFVLPSGKEQKQEQEAAYTATGMHQTTIATVMQ